MNASVRALTFEFRTDNSFKSAGKSTPNESLSSLLPSSASRRVATLAEKFCKKRFHN